jgi:PAS domain S-box-containing protein
MRMSDPYFQAIVNLVPDLLWRNDLKGNAVWYNQRWYDYTGQTFEEAQGNGWLDVIHPDDRAQSYANFHNAVKECRPLRQEHRIRSSDGNYRWFLVQAQPTEDDTGNVLWFGSATDIHEQRTALERLRESEELTRTVMRNLPGGAAFIVDRDLRYVLAEGEALFAAGFKSEDLVGHTISGAMPSELVQPYEALYRQALAGNGFEHEHNSHDRTYISRGTPLRTANGDVYAVLAVSYDITDRKRQEQHQFLFSEISQELVGLANIAETMNRLGEKIGRYFGVKQCTFSEISEDFETAMAAYGWNAEGSPSLKGTYRMRDFLTDEQIAAQMAGEASIVNDTQTDPRVSAESYGALGIRSFVIVPLVRDNVWRFMLSIIDNQPRQWREDEVDLMREITNRIWTRLERARAEAAMRESEIGRIREQAAREQESQRAEALAELDRAKTMFFSNVSHEFRTPLTLLLGPLQEALNDPALSPTNRERLELAHRNSLRLLKLVNTLLDFSRIEAGRMEAVYEPTDLSQFTAELASVFRSAIEQADLQLVVDCLPLPEAVYVDRDMWEKIVLNLISNAFKFTLEGEIRVSLHPVAHHVILEIEDTGSGIAPEALPHLFDRFYQVRGVKARSVSADISARSHEGSGIGLALVHELVHLQGGTINVSSTVGQGTCFTIVLPFGLDHLPQNRIKASHTLTSTAVGAAPYVQEAELWRSLENSDETHPKSKIQNPKSNVLVVDDNADMRDYLTRILSEHVHVEAVGDGVSALSAIQTQQPDLVLTDVMMPGLDGFQLLQALRAEPHTREIPILLLSARAGEEAIVEGLAAGADDYLIKPFSAQELVSRVNAHLQMAQLRGELLDQERTMSRRKDELLSTVSHELNTPLVAILGWTRLLRSSPPSSLMLAKALDTIERNATLQAKLVQDLLDISRITAGRLRLHSEEVDLRAVIESAIATVAQLAAAKGIDLIWQDYLAHQNTVVMGDRDRLQQVFCNLLTNAIKFTPEFGRATVELSTFTEQNASYAEIQVIDTGIGISAAFLPYVFDRFRQADGPTSSKGLGVGLAIAQHLVELHQGTIQAESAGADQGARFTVRLPLLSDRSGGFGNPSSP